jgi:hypothetical protein
VPDGGLSSLILPLPNLTSICVCVCVCVSIKRVDRVVWLEKLASSYFPFCQRTSSSSSYIFFFASSSKSLLNWG